MTSAENTVLLDKIERQLASVVHAARVAGPFDTSKREGERSLKGAKRKLVRLIRFKLFREGR